MDKDDLNRYLPDEIDGWRTTGDAESYDRDGIFRYINGAGEVYRQYDYRQLLVKRYSGTGNIKITAELFDMGIPSDAYGIFSHSRETPDIGMGQGSEFKSGLLCFWKNRYFVCFYSKEQNNRTDIAITEFAAMIDSLIPENGNIPEIVGFLPKSGLAETRVRFFHKYTSLNLHYYLADDNLLNLDENTDVVLAEYEPGKIHLLLAGYPGNRTALDALDRFKSAYIPEADESGSVQIEDGKWVSARIVENFVLVVLDSPDLEKADDLINKTIENISASIK
ncbi:MAG: DUF6599 family protein [candidate division Zixibacteria bacterium]